MTRYISCFKALSLRQNKLCPNRKPSSLFILPTSSQRQSYILLSKSQYNLLYNIAISSNRFVYNVKKFHTKVQNNMYLQYNLFFFFPYKRTSANPVCALYWTAAHLIKKLSALAVNICGYKQIQIRHWQGSKKKIWSFFKCHCITASHCTSNSNLPW